MTELKDKNMINDPSLQKQMNEQELKQTHSIIYTNDDFRKVLQEKEV